MKQRIILLATALLAISFANAQSGFHLGFKAGTNITKVDGKAMSDEFQFGYNLGGFAEIGLNKKWFIEPEIMWNQVNTKTGENFHDIINGATEASSLQDVKLNYLSIPITLNYRLTDWLSLHAGPQFGILMNSERTLLQNGKEAFKNGDLSLIGGAQVNIGAFRFTGRVFTSLNNVNTGDVNDAWKNKGYQLGVGYRIL